jgi:hypothetical protein
MVEMPVREHQGADIAARQAEVGKQPLDKPPSAGKARVDHCDAGVVDHQVTVRMSVLDAVYTGCDVTSDLHHGWVLLIYG